MTKRYYETQEAAIKDAKSRAKSRYRTQLIYDSEQGFYLRELLGKSQKPILKVFYDGKVQSCE